MPENKAVGILSELLSLECGYNPAEARLIRMAAILHDCGKQRIPKHIKDKAGKLTVQEIDVMKTHTKIGFDMLSCLRGEIREVAQNVALWHHEFWNGQGYWGVKSSALPRYVGIVSLCDVLVALIYRRVYKPAWPPTEALEYIKSMAGIQFCPELTDIFIWLIRGNSRIIAVFEEVSA